MSASDAVSLLIDGDRYDGWKSVSVTAGIDRAARDFTLGVTERWPGSDVQRRIKPGDKCIVMIGADKVLTGYVDATPISYDASSITVGVKGRSLTADLIDCAANYAGGQWSANKVERIAEALAKPYGISVKTDTQTGAAITDHQVQPGESVMESLHRLMSQRRLLATDDANGALVFIEPGVRRATTALVLGGPQGNILTASVDLDYKDRYSEYKALGQQALTDVHGTDGAVSSKSASAKDDGIKRYRLLVIQQGGQGNEGTLQQRVTHERDIRAGRPFATTYTVAGWRQGDGTLWQPNQLVSVSDAIIGFNETMLISEVTYVLNDNGMQTTLKVAPPAAYQLPPASGAKSATNKWRDVKSAIDAKAKK